MTIESLCELEVLEEIFFQQLSTIQTNNQSHFKKNSGLVDCVELTL